MQWNGDSGTLQPAYTHIYTTRSVLEEWACERPPAEWARDRPPDYPARYLPAPHPEAEIDGRGAELSYPQFGDQAEIVILTDVRSIYLKS